MIHYLPRHVWFPDPFTAEPNGLLAAGGDLSPERLLAAYSQGIFPWYDERTPILWWSTDPRPIIDPAKLKVSRRLARTARSGRFTVTFNQDFRGVIENCARVPRPGQPGTWLMPEMIEAYTRLHELGYAHSVEAWQDGELAGGLYGVALGKAFFGESMFRLVPDASKVAFVKLCEFLASQGVRLVDCQQVTPHMLKFGAVPVSRAEFMRRLREALE